jgi:hypothetical protein
MCVALQSLDPKNFQNLMTKAAWLDLQIIGKWEKVNLNNKQSFNDINEYFANITQALSLLNFDKDKYIENLKKQMCASFPYKFLPQCKKQNLTTLKMPDWKMPDWKMPELPHWEIPEFHLPQIWDDPEFKFIWSQVTKNNLASEFVFNIVLGTILYPFLIKVMIDKTLPFNPFKAPFVYNAFFTGEKYEIYRIEMKKPYIQSKYSICSGLMYEKDNPFSNFPTVDYR